MANLRVNKITGTEVFETTGSVQFNDGYLSFDKNILLDLNNYSDWTIECWIYRTANATNERGLIIGFDLSGSIDSNILAVHNDGYLYMGSDGGGNATPKIQTPNNTISFNTWYHISAVKKSTSIKLFVNGIESASGTRSTWNFTDLSIPGLIGSRQANDTEFFGHISNLRVLKGTALYTSNFTPPTRELTVIPNTVLLCCQSTTRANEERTGKTITVNGNAVANELTPGLLTDRVKSGGDSAISGSVEFDGTGDWLSIPSSSDFDFGSTNDFTIECWIYQQNRDPTYYTSLFQTDGSNLGGLGLVISPGSSGILQIYRGVFIVSSTSSVPTNGWVHIAATRNSGTTRLFINGGLDGSSAISYTPTFNDIRIGLNPSSGVEKFQGFISNLRVIKGTALYTQNFIPPTRELKRLPGTVLLCCQNSKSATQEATDKTITVNGNATARNFAPSVGSDGSVTFDGVTKINTPNYFYLPTGNTEDRGRGRGVFGGGYVAPTVVNTIDYISISNTGNAIDFGDMITPSSNSSALGSSTRGVVGGISTPTTVNTIEYITFASTSNSFDFGDLTVARWGTSTVSNTTRGIFYSGYVAPANVNVIDYITIASIGNATDFGDAITAGRSGDGCSSSIRGIFASGVSPFANTIEYLTISSTGNSQDFGDLTVGRITSAASSSPTRAIFAGGYVGPAGQLTNTIDYITISSTGNAQDFGDLTRINWSLKGLSNSIRGIIGGGYVAPVYNNNIDYVTISSTGNAQDFGDMTSSRGSYSACSDSHGGLG